MEIKLYLYISSIREESDQKYLFNRTQNSRQMGISKNIIVDYTDLHFIIEQQ